jgi:phasin family protein
VHCNNRDEKDLTARKNSRGTKAKPAARTAPATEAIGKGIEMQTEAAEVVTERVQAIFGDVNEQARVVFEKNARLLEELTDLTRGNVEALVASSKLAAKGVETLSQEAAEYGRKSFEEASSALRSFAEIKSPTDLFKLQSEFAKSQFDSIVAQNSKLSEAALKLAGEMIEPLSSRYSVAAERVKSALVA